MSNPVRKAAAQAALREARLRAATLVPDSTDSRGQESSVTFGGNIATPGGKTGDNNAVIDSFSSSERDVKRVKRVPPSEPASDGSGFSVDEGRSPGDSMIVPVGLHPAIANSVPAVPVPKPQSALRSSTLATHTASATPATSPVPPSALDIMSGIPSLLTTASTVPDGSPGALLFSHMAASAALAKNLSLKKLQSLLRQLKASPACVTLSKLDSITLLCNIRGTIGKLEIVDDDTWTIEEFCPASSDFNRALFPEFFGLPDAISGSGPGLDNSATPAPTVSDTTSVPSEPPAVRGDGQSGAEDFQPEVQAVTPLA
jgi:hypothetical protein